MSSEQFKSGAVVRLKSGGPNMTVVGVESSTGRLVCKWFDGNKVSTGAFFSFELIEVPEEDGPSALSF